MRVCCICLDEYFSIFLNWVFSSFMYTDAYSNVSNMVRGEYNLDFNLHWRYWEMM